MKHSVLAALSAVLAKPSLFRASGADQWRDVLARLNKTGWLLANPRTCFALARVCASSKMKPLLRIEPRLMFKFLRDYLATDLLRSERAAMLIHHYTFLQEHADQRFFSRIVDRRIELWRLIEGEHVHRVLLIFPRTPYSEGDLALIFEADGVDIYTVSFTIGPGSIAGLDARDAMYIARVQGKGKGLDRIRDATKSCSDVSPAMLLLAAAEGIAQALDLENMIGIGASTQVTTSNGTQPENFAKAYDEFWTAASGSLLPRNMYRIAVPSLGKPILSIKRDHRSRTHRKRKFRKAVKDQVAEAFRDALRPAIFGNELATRSAHSIEAPRV